MAAVGRENATLEASWEAPGRSSGVPQEAFQEAPGPSEARVRHQADVTVIFKSRVAPKTLLQASQEAPGRRPGESQEGFPEGFAGDFREARKSLLGCLPECVFKYN